jgi:hypothetical protein
MAIFGHCAHRTPGILRLGIDQPAEPDQMCLLTIAAGHGVGTAADFKSDLSHPSAPRGCDKRIDPADRRTDLLAQLFVPFDQCRIAAVSFARWANFGCKPFDASGSTLQPSDSEFQAVVGHRCYHSM